MNGSWISALLRGSVAPLFFFIRPKRSPLLSYSVTFLLPSALARPMFDSFRSYSASSTNPDDPGVWSRQNETKRN